jgi:hypothetical protein
VCQSSERVGCWRWLLRRATVRSRAATEGSAGASAAGAQRRHAGRCGGGRDVGAAWRRCGGRWRRVWRRMCLGPWRRVLVTRSFAARTYSASACASLRSRTGPWVGATAGEACAERVRPGSAPASDPSTCCHAWPSKVGQRVEGRGQRAEGNAGQSKGPCSQDQPRRGVVGGDPGEAIEHRTRRTGAARAARVARRSTGRHAIALCVCLTDAATLEQNACARRTRHAGHATGQHPTPHKHHPQLRAQRQRMELRRRAGRGLRRGLGANGAVSDGGRGQMR